MTDHTNRAHYTYGASGAHRWKVCHASTYAEAGRADEASLYAKDGTEAHELLDFALEIGSREASEAQAWGEPSKLGLDEEGLTKRANAVQVALDYVYKVLDENPDAVLVREKQYRFANPYTDDAGGTVDVGIYIPSMNWLYVPDYKHGVGKVDIDDNAQTYMYGCELVLGPDAPFPEAEFITLAIIQPNAFGPDVKEIVVSREALEAYAAETAEDIHANMTVVSDAATYDIESKYEPGEKQCQWCKARNDCKARDRWYVVKMGGNFKSVIQIGNELPAPVPSRKQAAIAAAGADSPEEVGRKMAAYQFIADFCKDYIDAGKSRVRKLEKIPGWKLVEAQARSKWLEETQERAAQALVAQAGLALDVAFPRKLMNITDAKAAVKASYIDMGVKSALAAQQADEYLAQFIDKSSSRNLTVVLDTDKRQAVTPTLAVEETFAGVHILPQE